MGPAIAIASLALVVLIGVLALRRAGGTREYSRLERSLRALASTHDGSLQAEGYFASLELRFRLNGFDVRIAPSIMRTGRFVRHYGVHVHAEREDAESRDTTVSVELASHPRRLEKIVREMTTSASVEPGPAPNEGAPA